MTGRPSTATSKRAPSAGAQRSSTQNATRTERAASASLIRTIVLFLCAVAMRTPRWVGSVAWWAGVVEQPVERQAGPALGGRVAQQPARVVVGQHHPVQVVGELLRVGVGAELAL